MFVVATLAQNIPAMLILFALCSLTNCSMMGTFNALVAEASEWTTHKTGKRLDGSMYSCTSFGMKVGSGIGSGMLGWLLSVAGFDETLAVQTTSVNNMLVFMFAVVPVLVALGSTVIYYFLKVEKENQIYKNRRVAGGRKYGYLCRYSWKCTWKWK